MMNMQTIQLEINSDIYDKVMSFLEILPKNMIRIYPHKNLQKTHQDELDVFKALSQNISSVDKNIDILSLDKEMNNDIF